MASPRSAGGGVAGDEAIWRKLREAGFDEDAVRRRDKAALIGYISRLESEVEVSSRWTARCFWFSWLGGGGVRFLVTWPCTSTSPVLSKGGEYGCPVKNLGKQWRDCVVGGRGRFFRGGKIDFGVSFSLPCSFSPFVGYDDECCCVR